MGDANTVILPLKIGFIIIQIVLTILIAYSNVRNININSCHFSKNTL